MFCGPWSDQAGRKLPLMLGIVIFFLGSVLCTFTPSGHALLVGRFIQGLGGAAVMVIPRAVIQDMYTGHRATQLMAALMLVISISPFLAPLAGASLLQFLGCRAIFAILTIVSLASLLFQTLFLTENVGRLSPGAPFGMCPFSGP